MSDSFDSEECFKKYGVDRLIAKVPLSSKKSSKMGVVIPHKIRNCNNCTKDFLCDECDEFVNQNKKFFAELDELKREPPNQFAYMLPKYISSLKVIIKVFKWL